MLVNPSRIGTLNDVPHAQMQALSDECAAFATAEDINLGDGGIPLYRA